MPKDERIFIKSDSDTKDRTTWKLYSADLEVQGPYEFDDIYVDNSSTWDHTDEFGEAYTNSDYYDIPEIRPLPAGIVVSMEGKEFLIDCNGEAVFSTAKGYDKIISEYVKEGLIEVEDNNIRFYVDKTGREYFRYDNV